MRDWIKVVVIVIIIVAVVVIVLGWSGLSFIQAQMVQGVPLSPDYLGIP